MARSKKKKKSQPSQDLVPEGASGGGDEVPPQQQGNDGHGGKKNFAELQVQSTLHLEADVRSNGLLKLWGRKTLLVTPGVLYICKNKSDGGSEKKMLVSEQTELQLVAPNRKNGNRHQLIIDPDKSKLKVALDSAREQGALAKALDDEGARVTGMESLTIYRTYINNCGSRDRNAPQNNPPEIFVSGPIDHPTDPDGSLLSSDATGGKASGNSSFAAKLNDEGFNIYEDLNSNDSLPPSSPDATNSRSSANDALAVDDSFYKTLEIDEDSSPRDAVTNDPLYKNFEVKLYKQNLRKQREAEIYNRLDHGYEKDKKLMIRKETRRPAPAVPQNSMLNSDVEFPDSESTKELTDSEEIYETTIQIGQILTRLNSNVRTDESSGEGTSGTNADETSSVSTNETPPVKKNPVLTSVEEVDTVSDDVNFGSQPTVESFPDKTVKSEVTDGTKPSLDGREEPLQSNVLADDTDKLEDKTKADEKEDEEMRPEFQIYDQIYGSIDQKTYGALYGKESNDQNANKKILVEEEIEDESTGIYEEIWNATGISKENHSSLDVCEGQENKVLMAGNQLNENDSLNDENSSIEQTEMKSNISDKTEFNTINDSSLENVEIPVPGEIEDVVSIQNRNETQASSITSSSDSPKEENCTHLVQEDDSVLSDAVSVTNHSNNNEQTFTDDKTFTNDSNEVDATKQNLGNVNMESNSSQSSLPIKDDDLVSTFVEKFTETYGPHRGKSMLTDSVFNQEERTNEGSGIPENCEKESELESSESLPMDDFKGEVQPGVTHDTFEEEPPGYQNGNNDVSQLDDGKVENSHNDGAANQEGDSDVSAQSVVIQDDHIDTDHVVSQEEVDTMALNIDTQGSDHEYDLSELVSAIAENSVSLPTDNNVTLLHHLEHPEETSRENSAIVKIEEFSSDSLHGDIVDDEKKVDSEPQIGKFLDEEECESQDPTGENQYQNEFVDKDEANDKDNLSLPPDEISSSGQIDIKIAVDKDHRDTDIQSCLVQKTSSDKTKKKVRFSDDVEVQCLEAVEDDSDNDSVFLEDTETFDSESEIDSTFINLSIEGENDLEINESNLEIDQNFSEITGPSLMEFTKSNSSPKTVKNSSATNQNVGSTKRGPESSSSSVSISSSSRTSIGSSSSRLQQPNKVVLPGVVDNSGRGKAPSFTSSSAIPLEPNAGTCLVDFSRGGRLYHRRILKVEDGNLHFFQSPPEKNRRGSKSEKGEEGTSQTARPVHTAQLVKSSVVPSLMADGEGLYSITLTLPGGKTVLLKSSSRDEQMKLVFLLSDEVVRVTPEEDRVGLHLYPSKVKEPSSELEDMTQATESSVELETKAQLSTSPKINTASGTFSPVSDPIRSPTPTPNESTQPIKHEPSIEIQKMDAVPKVSPETKSLPDATVANERQLFWQNILKNKNSSIVMNSTEDKELEQTSRLTFSPPTPNSTDKSRSLSSSSSPNPSKTVDKIVKGEPLVKPIPSGANGVKQTAISRKFSLTIEQTSDGVYQHSSKASSDSRENEETMPSTKSEVPVTGTVSKLRLIFEIESNNSNGFDSLPNFRHSFRTQRFQDNFQGQARFNSLKSRPKQLDRQNSFLFSGRLFDGEAAVPEDVVGAYAQQPVMVIEERPDPSSQVEDEGAGLSGSSSVSRLEWPRRYSFGAARVPGQRSGTPSAEDAISEAINPVLRDKRQVMDSKMVVAEIRRTRDHLANRALEQWQMAQQMDEGQQLE